MWFYGGSVVNFNHVNDPQLNADLDKGRRARTPPTRTAAYEDFNKRMTDQLYNFWTWYNQWFIATPAATSTAWSGRTCPTRTATSAR